MGPLNPAARFYERGEKREPSPPDPDRAAAVAATAEAIKPLLGPACQSDPSVIVETVMARYIMERAAQAYKDPEIRKALSSERPWDMVRLIEPGLQAEAASKAVIFVAADLVSQIDPSGQKSFWEWAKEDILRLFEAVIWAWEESQGRINVAHGIVPAPACPPPAPDGNAAKALVMAGIKLPASQYRGPIIDDEIPF